ncbi:hypothetical protein BJX63DRAFT_386318 [Aspergillus granulosus]|uniref:Uncharacterized protein n=1 Tax=Aspergillus granulosus TaxID=176169 RepID=A0ABR4HNX3_9EURO
MLPFPTKSLGNHLRYVATRTWGFVIYRTTYTPYSHQRFPQIVEILNSCIRSEIFTEYASYAYDIHGRPIDCRALYDLIWARHRPVIMDNPAKFNRISLEAVRSHFESWVGPEEDVDPNRQTAQTHACLVVDEEVLNVLSDVKPLPEDVSVEYLMPATWWVKSVEAYPDLEDDPLEVWDGTLKVPIRGLWHFWKMVDDPASMQELITKDGIYDV